MTAKLRVLNSCHSSLKWVYFRLRSVPFFVTLMLQKAIKNSRSAQIWLQICSTYQRQGYASVLGVGPPPAYHAFVVRSGYLGSHVVSIAVYVRPYIQITNRTWFRKILRSSKALKAFWMLPIYHVQVNLLTFNIHSCVNWYSTHEFEPTAYLFLQISKRLEKWGDRKHPTWSSFSASTLTFSEPHQTFNVIRRPLLWLRNKFLLLVVEPSFRHFDTKVMATSLKKKRIAVNQTFSLVGK